MSEQTIHLYHARETWTCPDGVSWVVERRGIRLFRTGSGEERFLPYPEAALWDLASRHRYMEEMTDLLAAILDLPREEVAAWASGWCRQWAGSRWLQREKHHG